MNYRTAKRPATFCLLPAALCLLLFSAACMVGPNYQRPKAPVSPAYKETPPADWKEAQDWKQAQPNEAAKRGKWWEIYNDPELNALEEQVSLSNQNVLAAEAQFREARYAVRIARSSLFPTVSVSPSIVNEKSVFLGVSNFVPAPVTAYDLPVAVSYQADIWGSIRRSVTASGETAQASAATLENARLSYQAELAQDYFELRGADGEKELLETTVKSYDDYLKLTQDRFNSGVASGSERRTSPDPTRNRASPVDRL